MWVVVVLFAVALSDRSRLHRCECKKSCGAIMQTQLDVANCDYFGNQDGRLFCDVRRHDDDIDDTPPPKPVCWTTYISLFRAILLHW